MNQNLSLTDWLQPYTSWPTMQKADSLDQEAAGPPEYPHQLSWATTNTAQTLKQKQEFRQERRQQWQIAKDMERPKRQQAITQQQPAAKSRCRPSQFRHHPSRRYDWGLGMAGKWLASPVLWEWLRFSTCVMKCEREAGWHSVLVWSSLAVGLACSFSGVERMYESNYIIIQYVKAETANCLDFRSSQSLTKLPVTFLKALDLLHCCICFASSTCFCAWQDNGTLSHSEQHPTATWTGPAVACPRGNRQLARTPPAAYNLDIARFWQIRPWFGLTNGSDEGLPEVLVESSGCFCWENTFFRKISRRWT